MIGKNLEDRPVGSLDGDMPEIVRNFKIGIEADEPVTVEVEKNMAHIIKQAEFQQKDMVFPSEAAKRLDCV